MSKDPMQRYAESLEKTIQHNYSHLKEVVEDFKGLCLVVTPEKHTPQDIIVDIRELYKEIRDRLAEIKAIQQLLQGKYRMYYRRDSLRDKAIMEFGFLTKNLYSKFEYILLQKQALTQKREEETSRAQQKGFHFQWFRSRENQIIFVRNLRILNELDYEAPSDLGIEERREVPQEKIRHLTLFCLKGTVSTIDEVYSRIRLREHDIIEQYAQGELHGLITHLREVSPVDVENVFQRILKSGDFSKLKGLLIPIRSPKDLEGPLFDSAKKTLDEMEEGEVKTLRFPKNPEISDFTD
ncbi:MAG: hypothetical protein A2V86_11920 [Deltaproteobacteria bacterium RBG_16_49_23]|nr:MAG: hypothetical protein A2V86_11920 [Deltaproteobacteria bacterium RBG_16_49_23]